MTDTCNDCGKEDSHMFRMYKEDRTPIWICLECIEDYECYESVGNSPYE